MARVTPRLIALLATVALLAACRGGPAAVPGAADGAAAIRRDAVPPTLVGLLAGEEDVSAQFRLAEDRSYATGVRMWSLREGDRLRATLQIARFAPDARIESRDFQRTVVSQIGKAIPQLRRVGGQNIYVTTGDRQTLFMWFEGLHFVVLSVSVDFKSPRSLVRAAVEGVNP